MVAESALNDQRVKIQVWSRTPGGMFRRGERYDTVIEGPLTVTCDGPGELRVYKPLEDGTTQTWQFYRVDSFSLSAS